MSHTGRLDLIVHRSDVPILPAYVSNLPLLGFGLWRVPTASIALDAVLLLVPRSSSALFDVASRDGDVAVAVP